NLDAAFLSHEPPGAFYNRYQYPIIFSTPEQRDRIAEFLFSRQIDTSRPLDEVVDVTSRYYGYAGDCPVGEQLSKRTLVIPNYHTMTDEDVERVAQVVNEGWSKIENRVHSDAGTLAEMAVGSLLSGD